MRKVLLAVDGSLAAEHAARFLAHLPHPDRVDLTIISVVQHPSVHGSTLTSELLELAYERDKQFAIDTYQKVAAMFEGANVEMRHLVEEGNIGEAVVEAAKEIDADLVVVGATGRSQISRVVLGSVSDHVATHAGCSVLVVRPTEISKSARPIRVCLSYEGSGPSQAALEEISEIPWHTGTDFHVLSVASYIYDIYGELTDDCDTTIRRSEDLKLAKEQLEQNLTHTETHLVEHEHIGEGIVNFAENHDVDLLVIGETPRNAIGRFLMGSTTRYVLRHAPCSVWITRNRQVQGLRKAASRHQEIG